MRYDQLMCRLACDDERQLTDDLCCFSLDMQYPLGEDRDGPVSWDWRVSYRPSSETGQGAATRGWSRNTATHRYWHHVTQVNTKWHTWCHVSHTLSHVTHSCHCTDHHDVIGERLTTHDTVLHPIPPCCSCCASNPGHRLFQRMCQMGRGNVLFLSSTWPSEDTFFPGTAIPTWSEDMQTLLSSCTSTALPLDAQTPEVHHAKVMAGDYINQWLGDQCCLMAPLLGDQWRNGPTSRCR